MNLYTLADAVDEHLLHDGTWQKADFYDLSTNNRFWNRAGIITLSKTFTASAAAAIIYLLQKECNALKIWERTWGTGSPTVSDFINFVLSEKAFTSDKGLPVSEESFWEKYSAFINAITAEPGFEFSKNEEAQPFTELIIKDEIMQVICFDDTWDEENYFIETNKEWILYQWATAV